MKFRTITLAVSLLICLSFSQLAASYNLENTNYNNQDEVHSTGLVQPQKKIKKVGGNGKGINPKAREEEEGKKGNYKRGLIKPNAREEEEKGKGKGKKKGGKKKGGKKVKKPAREEEEKGKGHKKGGKKVKKPAREEDEKGKGKKGKKAAREEEELIFA
jgi:hypothetical protein